MRIADRGPVRQVAWVTTDLDGAVERWRSLLGVGPWTIYRNVELQGEYRSSPVTVRMDVALSHQGELQIEIIAPHGSGPSPYHHDDGSARVGMHHVAWLVDSVEEAASAAAGQGLSPLFRAEAGGGVSRVAYLQASDDDSMLFEFIEATPPIVEGLEAGIAAARDPNARGDITTIDFAS